MGDNFVYIDTNSRMCIRQEHQNIPITSFTGVKMIYVVNADVCIVHDTLGVCMFNIRTSKCLQLNVKIEDSIERQRLEKDKHVISLPHDIDVIVLKTKRIKIDDRTIDKVVLVAETLLLVIEVPEQQNNECNDVSITTAIHLPGYPTDFCFVSKNCGFLVSWKHISERVNDLYAREHLFHFSPDGKLLGIISFLGTSPFSFSPVFLDGDLGIKEKYLGYGRPGWYVYMRDGHGGILCVKVMDC
ncbi:uncharacterized protein LOC134680892 isoform X1 [Mytilus trossulus]|uniref:uncharacterized protein LOC134680892 isoform X1 n=1 Tax=Mytilus trossulus TaxID=6551 RepID=UPI003004D2DE